MDCGLYFHIPFCRGKCAYCSFNSVPAGASGTVIDDYISRMLGEIDHTCEVNGRLNADTLYFGGGTPSMLRPEQIGMIIDRAASKFQIRPGAEITVEMNPDDVSAEKLLALTGCGVNRIVLGVQTMSDRLRLLIGRSGRLCTDADLDTFFSCGDFTRCVDIMAGLPGQSETELMNDLGIISSGKAEHISLYLLSVDEGTPLSNKVLVDESFESDQVYLWGKALDFLSARGYRHYEVSNHSLPGYESRHNSKYWSFIPYAGFGAGAHSFLNGERFWNESSPHEYAACDKFKYRSDQRSGKDMAVEFFMTALRRMSGFTQDEFRQIAGFPLPEEVAGAIIELEEGGMLSTEGGKISLTRMGLYQADSVIFRLAEMFIDIDS